MNTKIPRGLRNNNPGNIDYNLKNKWQGQIGIETNVPQGVKPRFAKFKDVIYGIRAIAVLLIKYYDSYDCNTPLAVANRWAPPVENDTGSYAKQMARDITKAVGYTIRYTDRIDLHDYKTLRAMICSIIEHENGLSSYKEAVKDAQVDKALVMAGVQPDKKPLAKSRTVQASTVAAATGGTAVLAGAASQIATVAPAVPVVTELADAAQSHPNGLLMIFGAIVIIAAAYILWVRWDDRRRGLK
jgi:hypothetical protein